MRHYPEVIDRLVACQSDANRYLYDCYKLVTRLYGQLNMSVSMRPMCLLGGDVLFQARIGSAARKKASHHRGAPGTVKELCSTESNATNRDASKKCPRDSCSKPVPSGLIPAVSTRAIALTTDHSSTKKSSQ